MKILAPTTDSPERERNYSIRKAEGRQMRATIDECMRKGEE
jgi:hypothetical protein